MHEIVQEPLDGVYNKSVTLFVFDGIKTKDFAPVLP
jgi:hypothetical protein